MENEVNESGGSHWQSAGILVYRYAGNELFWLLVDSKLSRARHAWEFPKGLVETGEDALTAALRECAEESGVLVERQHVHPTFHEKVEWTMHRDCRRILRTVDYFLAQAFDARTAGDCEVREVRWMLTEDTLQCLRHQDLKKVLGRALHFVSER